MREIRVGDASITMVSSEGVEFSIQTRKEFGIAVWLEGKKVLSLDKFGRKE